MPILQPNTLRSNELPELVFRGPFGGIQSELPLDAIETKGFYDIANVLLNRGMAWVRSPLIPIAGIPAPAEAILAIADFFTGGGVRLNAVATPTRLIQRNALSGAWTPIAGALTAGNDAGPYSWTIVGGKLCFSRNKDKVKVWDGGANFVDASVDAVPARFVAEIANHLVVGYTTEVGPVSAPQRIRWTAAGDVTDWVGPNAGQNDLFNNLGPITGIRRLYQQGYAFQQWGITQIIPTGIGTRPFDFAPLAPRSPRGCPYPWTIDTYGDLAFYVGLDDVYVFNGSESQPIGGGARQAILDSVVNCTREDTVLGFRWAYGFIFNYFYLIVTDNGVVWCYNIKENNWTRLIVNFDITQKCGGRLVVAFTGTEVSPPPFRDKLIFGENGGVIRTLDPINIVGGVGPEAPWSMRTGQLACGDYRHTKTLSRVRLTAQFLPFAANQCAITVKATNELGVSKQQTKYMSSSSAHDISYALFELGNLSGRYFTVEVFGPANPVGAFSFVLTELALIFDVGGELRVNFEASPV